MNPRNRPEITQIMSAEFEMNRSNFPLNFLKEVKFTHDFQAYAYYQKFTGDEISQQSADQFSRSCFKPVEFDGFRIKAEIRNPEPEQGWRS